MKPRKAWLMFQESTRAGIASTASSVVRDAIPVAANRTTIATGSEVRVVKLCSDPDGELQRLVSKSMFVSCGRLSPVRRAEWRREGSP